MTADDQFRAAYLSALQLPNPVQKVSGISESADSRSDPKRAALRRAHDLRKFEIENYWKRATYFWAFQLAAFTLFGLIWKETGEGGALERLALLVPAGLGAISARVGWLTAKGSKFWQENWESHVDMLEQEVEGRMTQVVLSKSGSQFSVSAANQNFMLLLTLGWVAAFVVIVYPLSEAWVTAYAGPAALIAIAASMIFLTSWSRTNLKGWRFQLSQKEWQPYTAVSEKAWFDQVIMNGFIRLAAPEAEIIVRDTAAGRANKPEARPE